MLKKALRRAATAGLVCLALSLGACSDPPPNTPPAGGNATTQGKNDQTDSLSLALQSVDLTQGEGGFEIWRLKAEWANMEQEDGKIIVRAPKLTYFMPPPDKGELHVTSDSGTVDQKSQILRFVDNVVVTQGTNQMTGHILVYNGTARNMTFPEGGIFSGDGMNGNAQLVRWYMDQRRIEAMGGVTVDFQDASGPQKAPTDAAAKDKVQ